MPSDKDRRYEAPKAPPPPPTRVLLGGKYEPVSPAGEGGMASVWMGFTHGEAGFRRRVAIKRVLRHLASDEKFEQMFVAEAHLISELNHPNIAQIHDFGHDEDGGYFIVMEWVSGLNLVDYTRAFSLVGKKTPWQLCAAIAIEVLRALSAAHSRTNALGRPAPIVHRDVTPANIMVGFNGSVKLTDFGLSRALDRPRTTDPNLVKGKIAYMAPELLQKAAPDARVDIFSVGVTLWEVIAGCRLFGGVGTDVDAAMRVLAGDVPPLCGERSDIPKALEVIVDRAIATLPEQRYQRATDMIEALSGLIRASGLPTDGTMIGASVKEAGDFLLEHG